MTEQIDKELRDTLHDIFLEYSEEEQAEHITKELRLRGYRQIPDELPLLSDEEIKAFGGLKRQVHDIIIDYNEKHREISEHKLPDSLDKMARGENIQGTINRLINTIAQAQLDSIKRQINEMR